MKERELMYYQAVVRMSLVLDTKGKLGLKGLDVFKASTLLAALFDLPKERTLEDLMEFRRASAS